MTGIWLPYVALFAWALSGLSRLTTLLYPPPGATETRAHTLLALLVLVGGLTAAVRRTPFPSPTSNAAAVGLHALLLIGLLAALTPLLTPFDPVQLDVGPHLAPPSLTHPLGTDGLGRDGLARCLFGARISLTVGALTVGLAMTLGVSLGAVAGFRGGWVDAGVVWLTDLLLAMPRLLLLMAVVGVLRPQGEQRLVVMIGVLGLTGWMGVGRVVRAQVRSLREREFVYGARASGASERRILWAEILPNALGPVVTYGCLGMGGAMLTEAALSFLGLGVPAPMPTWGGLVNEGRETLRSAPWVSLAPGMFLTATVVSVNLLGEGWGDRIAGRSG